MPRTILVHAITNNLVGDETFEVWLKHESDAWTLVDAGSVDQLSGSQDFTFPGLVDGASYSLQLRMKRAGRYRIGYLSADPETWPSQSRIDFSAGSLIGVGAPTLVSIADWVRTSSTHSHFSLVIEPDDISQDLELVRDGVVIHTFIAPLDYSIDYDDVDPPLGVNHTYKVRHIAGTLGGPFSNLITKFAGPGAVTGFVLSSAPETYGKYTVEWDDDSRTYRLEEDYLCPGSTFVLVTGGSALTGGDFEVTKSGFIFPPGATQGASFTARIRAEVTSFTVTDFSAWSEASISMLIDDPDSTGYNTCP